MSSTVETKPKTFREWQARQRRGRRQMTWPSTLGAAALFVGLSTLAFLWQRPLDAAATPVLAYSPNSDRAIALTFDDGPHPLTTALLLDTLTRFHVHATFMIVGEKASEAPELLRRIVAAGNEVESHTYSHRNLTRISPQQVAREFDLSASTMERIVGRRVTMMRPPGGDYDRDVIAQLRRRHWTLALWSDDPGDWANPPAKVIEHRVIGLAKTGSVVLMHDDGLHTVQALPVILDNLTHRGFRFVTASEMLALRR